GELAIEQEGGHEMPPSRSHPGQQFLARQLGPNEPYRAGKTAQPVAICTAQSRTPGDGAGPAKSESLADAFEEWCAVGVGQRLASRHLGDVRRRVMLVTFDKPPAERDRQSPSE